MIPVIKMQMNGVTVRTPKVGGVSQSYELIWSSNTGRNGNSTMVGTVKAEKRSFTVSWPPLTEEEFALIKANCSKVGSQWITVTFTMGDDTVDSFTAYTGTAGPTSEGWSLIGGTWMREDTKLEIIER